MTKQTLKRFFIITSLICFLTYSNSCIFAKSTSILDTNEIINNSYESIVNINKQLSVTLENYFLSLLNTKIPKPSSAFLKTYSIQLATIKKDLLSIINEDLDLPQMTNIEILLTSIDFLDSVISKQDTMFKSSNSTQQFVLFKSILYLDTLISQYLSSFK